MGPQNIVRKIAWSIQLVIVSVKFIDFPGILVIDTLICSDLLHFNWETSCVPISKRLKITVDKSEKENQLKYHFVNQLSSFPKNTSINLTRLSKKWLHNNQQTSRNIKNSKISIRNVWLVSRNIWNEIAKNFTHRWNSHTLLMCPCWYSTLILKLFSWEVCKTIILLYF